MDTREKLVQRARDLKSGLSTRELTALTPEHLSGLVAALEDLQAVQAKVRAFTDPVREARKAAG